ncbi:DUF4240 domain-containing protein [Kitasatospora cheerisanensis]|uniref:DUF4240 domain-containing protein n=1 Tax=Kitasatospora cheerisanensis KCTC 2395 TaxID=1348663 RepID=A0A066ZCR4_9ACTN|nr:DUF4240 domain-containing protein [Kitasatospora cheerisanensis]KDN88101.1 hypothetical protein KCH_01780 [Kitasatospora cheerisanensis KCTC 2395]
MDVEEFWALLDEACAEVDDQERDFDDRHEAISRACEERLVSRTPEEVVQFALRKWQLRDAAYRYDLWAAAFLIEGWWSDDGFMDFREGLISLGRHWYERALADPDSLADHPAVRGGGDVLLGNEDFHQVARRAYHRLTGEPDGLDEALAASPEAAPLRSLTHPTGSRWDVADDNEMRRHLPRLAAIFLD